MKKYFLFIFILIVSYLFAQDPQISVDPMEISEVVYPGEIVDVPLIISNTGGGDLSFDISVILGLPLDETIKIKSRIPSNNIDSTYNENDPEKHKVEYPPADDLFDLQFQYPTAVGVGEAGIESDGNYFYTTKWNGVEFYRYDLDGNLLATFQIPGASNVRDLAYDGQYFYGAAASTSLFQMDFTPGQETLISTIAAPVDCRAIAYDDDVNGFWANNWSSDITLFDMNGTVLNSFPCQTALSFYGFAYDSYSDGGPYLWGFSQAPTLTIVQFDLSTGLETGETFDVGAMLGSTGSAGGLFVVEGIVPDYVTLGGLIQNEFIFGLELCSTEEPWLSAYPLCGVVPGGSSSEITVTINATNLFNIVTVGELIISNNAGSDVIVPVTMLVANGPPPYPPENIHVNDETGIVTWTPPAIMIAEDDFDSYNSGNYLSIVSPDLWSTWSNLPGSGEDVIVTNTQAASPQNSILVEADNNILMNMDTHIDGVYSIEIDMFTPTGFCGYYNVQKTSIPGEELGFQAYFLTNGTAIIDAGASAAATFNYFHDWWFNLRLIIDLDNDWCDFYYNETLIIGYQWTLGASGVPGLVQLGGLNFQALAYSTTMDIPEFYVDNVKFKDLLSIPDGLIGYYVYLDGVLQNISPTIDEFYQLDTNYLMTWETYIAGVSAFYDYPAESDIIQYEFTWYGGGGPYIPISLEAEVQNYNEVLLNWDLPGGASEEIFYHTGYDNNGIGTNGVVDLICCARFTAEELAEYYGNWCIAGVNIFLHSLDFDYLAIQVYEGGNYGDPGTLIYDEDVTSVAVFQDWTNHLLSTPVLLIAGNEYWIGYEIHATGDHPCAVDMGPMVPDKGAWMYYDNSWQTLVDLGLDYNWVINGVVSQYDSDEMGIESQQDQATTNGTPKTAIIGNSRTQDRIHTAKIYAPLEAEFNRSIGKTATLPQIDSRSLAGYNIYRDDVIIVEVDDPLTFTFFDGGGLDAGNYEYYVTAVYENPSGESNASNIEEVEIILPAPTGVTATSNWPNILITWQAMPGVLSYNLYEDDVLLTNTNSTFYLYPYPTEMHCINLAAVFNGGWVGDWTDDLWIGPNPGADPNLIPLTTSLEGNYPNPFNPATAIKFGLHETRFVKIDIFNIKGEKVKTLVNNELEAEFHEVVWNGTDESGKDVSSGVYLYKMKSGDYQKTRKMILMK